MQNLINKNNIKELLAIANDASDLLNSYCNDTVTIFSKHDKSLVSNADMAANKLIVDKLQKFTPNIAIISEENAITSNKKAAQNNLFWLIDPLDGTRSFIKGGNEFAICIALIENNRPIFGLIAIPSTQEIFFTLEGEAFKQCKGVKTSIKTSNKIDNLHVLSSQRMVNNQKFSEFIAHYNIIKTSVISSAIKFCRIAEGAADLYPYFDDTMQWDSAAGDAIVHAAGGSVFTLEKNKLTYGTGNFVNPHFIVKG